MELHPTMANVGTARRFVRNELFGRIPEPAVADLMLIASELVTNAFEHGTSDPVRITVRSNTDEASVAVTSGGNAERVPALDNWTTAEADRLSGRGLGIVRNIADDIDVDRSGDTVTITVRRRFVAADT